MENWFQKSQDARGRNIFYMQHGSSCQDSALFPGEREVVQACTLPASYFWTVDGCVQNIVSVYSAVYSVQWCTVQSGHRCRLSDDDLSSCAGHTVLTTHPPVHSREISRMMMILRPHITWWWWPWQCKYRIQSPIPDAQCQFLPSNPGALCPVKSWSAWANTKYLIGKYHVDAFVRFCWLYLDRC